MEIPENESSQTNKFFWWIKYLLLTGVGIVCLVFCGAITIFFLAAAERTEYMTSRSPSNAYQVDLEYSGPFGFGSHTMYVYGTELPDEKAGRFGRVIRGYRNRRIHLRTFSLSNDGKNLNGNCSIRWETQSEQEIVIISCDGEEQPRKSYRIKMADHF